MNHDHYRFRRQLRPHEWGGIAVERSSNLSFWLTGGFVGALLIVVVWGFA